MKNSIPERPETSENKKSGVINKVAFLLKLDTVVSELKRHVAELVIGA